MKAIDWILWKVFPFEMGILGFVQDFEAQCRALQESNDAEIKRQRCELEANTMRLQPYVDRIEATRTLLETEHGRG